MFGSVLSVLVLRTAWCGSDPLGLRWGMGRRGLQIKLKQMHVNWWSGRCLRQAQLHNAGGNTMCVWGGEGSADPSILLLEDGNFALHLLIAKLHFTASVFFAWWISVLLVETILPPPPPHYLQQ